jgi:hypothetical protein
VRTADGSWQPLSEWNATLLVSLIAFVTDHLAIGKILDHLGLGTPRAEKPPPPVPEILRVAEHGDGWGLPVECE